jgi:hypothetical protein
MESDPIFCQYRDKRDRMWERLEVIRARVTEWVDRHAASWPELTDLARLEALHGEREQVLKDFQEAEDQFIEYVLKKRHD